MSYFELIERALGFLPKHHLSGIDLVVKDASAPASRGNHAILEFNTGPRLVDHHHPWRGQPRDVAGAIVDHLAGLVARREQLAADGKYV